MTIKELEERLGMTRANIRFYEQEGLLSPARTPNGYRDYSEEDIRTLEKIKLLRQLQLDLDTIRALQAGETDLPDALGRQLTALEADRAALEGSRSVCARLRAQGVSFADLDAAPWLREMGQLPDSPRFAAPRDELPPPPGHPFRRYLARGADLSLCSILLRIFLQYVLHVSLPGQGAAESAGEGLVSDLIRLLPWNMAKEFFTLENLLTTLVPLLLMLLTEPLLLHFWGTTPGKFLFGMKLRDSEGKKLSLADAFRRTWGVLLQGMGLYLPYFRVWRLFHSYNTVADRNERNPWEFVAGTGQPEQYLIPDGRRCYIPYTLLVLLVALWNGVKTFGNPMPPNRYIDFPYKNLLSEAEFRENYEYYLDRYYSDTQEALWNSGGEWTALYTDPNRGYVESSRQNEDGEWETVVTMDVTAPGAFRYTLRAPVSQYRDTQYPHPYQMATTAGLLAYAGAMPGESISSFRPGRMMDTLLDQELNYDFTFQMSTEGTWGKWYKSTGGGGTKIYVWDNQVHVSQRVIRETTGEPVYDLYDLEDPDEWLLLTFTVSNKVIRE